MRIPFDLDGSPAEFAWSSTTGSASLTYAGETTALQAGMNPASHVSVSTTRSWQREIGGHLVEVTKVRPWLLAGFRANAFEVRVDGRVVATAKGR